MMEEQNVATLHKYTKVVFVADNRNRENWGCRATSIALKEIIGSQCDIIYTIYGDITYSYNPVALYGCSKWTKIYKMMYNASNLSKTIFRRFDTADIIRTSVRESVALYRKAVKHNRCFQEIDEQIKAADAIVVNGEGTFIFSTPNRYDTIFYLLILRIAQEYGKRTYCLNAMFSDCPISARNLSLLDETREIFDRCTLVTARDPLSLDYCKSNIISSVKYVPDALFTWNKYVGYKELCMGYPFATISFPEKDYKWVDYSKPYISLSGSSLAARKPKEAALAYYELAVALHRNVLPTVIVSTCSGDAFLENVAQKAGLPYVAVETNILAGMSILGNASVFVSGRWHPSILASLSGTPCVFMGSNSHKTKAIQSMLGYSNIKEYHAIPTAQDIHGIVTDTKYLIENETTTRNSVMKKINQLGKEAIEGNTLFCPPK